VPRARIASTAPWGWVEVARFAVPRVHTDRGGERSAWTVFPRIRPMEAEEMERLAGEWSGALTAPHEPAVEPSGVRAYRPGDDLRWVHWKATAKRGKVMVKEFEALPHQAVVVHMPDLPPPGKVREDRISEVASVVTGLLEQDRLVQLRIGAWTSPFGAGRAHALDLLHVLANWP